MNEYFIYTTALFSSILFQVFWAWCNSPSKTKKQVKQKEEGRNAEIKKLQEKIKELEIAHNKEMRELRNQHRRALANKDRERHKSCESRNETIERLKEKNKFLHTRLIVAEKKVILLEKIKEIVDEIDPIEDLG
jgi:hypothetical protein